MRAAIPVFLIMLFCATVTTATQADETPNPLVDTVEVKVGGFFTSLDTNIRLDISTEDLGTIIDLEDDLDFSSSEEIWRLSGAYLFGRTRRHQLKLEYYKLSRDSMATIDEEIEWEDEVFPIEAEVTGFFDVEFAQLSYTYWAMSREKTALGATLGVVQIGLKAGIDLVEATQALSAGTDVNTDVPVPLLGLQLRQEIVPRLLFIAGAQYIYVSSIGDYSGNVLFAMGGLEYRPWEHFGFGVNYEYGKLEVEAEKGDFTGELDFTVHGLQAYLRFGF